MEAGMDQTNLPSGAGPANHKAEATRHACAITGRQRPKKDLVRLDTLRPALAERIPADHSELADDALIDRTEINRYRNLHVEEMLRAELDEFSELDRQVAQSIANHDTIAENVEDDFLEQRTLGQRLSDHLASFGGS